MKSKLLLGIMIVGMISATGCSNDADVVIGDDIPNSNSIENNEVISGNDNSESILDVVKNNINEDTIIVPSTNKENVIKKEDNNVEENIVNIKIENIPVGAYISYVPARGTVTVLGTDTGTGKDQTFTPTEYKDGWRVLYNNNGQLDIISAESVGKLTLGKKASSSNDEYDSVLNGGKIGYGKSIYILNKICDAYASGEYAISGRCLGIGNGVNNLFDEGISMDDLSYEKVKEKIDMGILTLPEDALYLPYVSYFPYGDTYNDKEIELIKNKMLHSNGSVWIASRYLMTVNKYADFIVRGLGSNGGMIQFSMYCNNTFDSPTSNSCTSGVRPVITLDSDLKVTHGEGTKDNPYIISK